MSSLFKLTCGFYESIAKKKKKPKTPQSLYKYQTEMHTLYEKACTRRFNLKV